MKYIPYGPSMLSYEMYTVYGMKFPHHTLRVYLPRVDMMGEGIWGETDTADCGPCDGKTRTLMAAESERECEIPKKEYK